MVVDRWFYFYRQFKFDIKLWFYFVLFQQCCQLSFILILSNHIRTETKIGDILQALLHGVRYSSLWATVWIFCPLLIITIPNFLFIFNKRYNFLISKFRKYWAGIFTFITAFIYIISIEYYREYKDLFNHFMFGLIYDDRKAIFTTILSEHNILLNIAILCFIMIVYIKYIKKYFIVTQVIINKKNTNIFTKIFIFLLIILFYVISFRGSIGPRPIQLKDAGVTQDPFLNKSIVSPYSALRYAIKEYNLISNVNKGYEHVAKTKDNIVNLAKRYFNIDFDFSLLSSYMKRTAKGSAFNKPKHIFLIVGESLDAWALQPKYREFDFVPNLNNLSKKGLYLKSFLPGSDGTMSSLNVIITGLLDMDFRTNYQPNSYKPYVTSIATQFKRLGFKPQFFYGGYLSWQRVEDFANQQGFECVYGASHISSWQHTNEWGVDDRKLFDFVLKTVQASDTPTFNIIMTTSNHPPFAIDLQKEGFDKERVEQLLEKYPNNVANIKELGHIWYADKVMGEFVAKSEFFLQKPLFIITGDHFGRRHILSNPPLFDVSSVPLILYGNDIEKYYQFPSLAAGSHLDIGSTLIELVAPKGFEYYAMGKNLFSAKDYSTLGIGKQRVITADFIAVAGSNEAELLSNSKKINLSELAVLTEKHNQAMGIAWWMIKKGDSF